MTEFMHYTLSRIATVDIIVAFFVICMFYGIIAFLQEEKNRYLVISGAAFALGVSTKWTALYGAAGIALILLIYMIMHIRRQKKEFKVVPFILICLGSFVILPAIVYVLSYIPFARVYTDKNIIQHAISNSISAYEYHKDVTSAHSYESKWYTWLFDWVPLVDFRGTVSGYKSVVATFVNPFICYIGLASVAHHIYLTVKKDLTSAILLVFYLSMLLPWVFISRTVFIYQYFICTKILILMICRSIQCLKFKKENSVIYLMTGVSAAFCMLYFPVISGVFVNSKYINEMLKIFPKWWF